MQTTSCVRAAAECTAHMFGEAAGLWLPQFCPCSKIKARAAILWQPRCCCRQDSGNHNAAAGKIMAKTPAVFGAYVLNEWSLERKRGATIRERKT